MGFFLVMKAELVRGFIIMRRYWFATLVGMIVGYVVLITVILAFLSNRGAIDGAMNGMGESVTKTALGMIIGMFAYSILGLFSQGLQSMASAGQLEQMCMSPHGLITNFLARSLVAAVSTIVSCAVLVALISLSVGGQLHAGTWNDWGPLLILLALTYCNLIGFGFMVGGLILVFKQVGQIVTLVRLGMLFLAMGVNKNAYDQWPLLVRMATHLLPITDAAICLKLVLLNGQEWDVLRSPHFAFLIVSCVLWTLLGILCFKFMENWSRDKGTLGTY